MGLRAYYLGDTSALARVGRAEVAERLVPLIEAGLVARYTPTELEAGYLKATQCAGLEAGGEAPLGA
ncbi:MAG: hypothetical protein M0Z87_00695 [Actinomycetota bacterium]|nr:hypothetical protein [Actinomycetota bacterium]